MEQYLWLIPVGFLIGAYGTLIGAGGGFLLVPLLLLSYPSESPGVLTSISLAVVFFNAFAGSVAYARMGRVDYRSALLFSVASVPGAVLGALTTVFVPRRLFDLILGALMIGGSAFLVFRGEIVHRTVEEARGQFVRTLVSRAGETETFSYNPLWGMALHLVVGYFSSALGIGGGIIQVPLLIRLLDFPVHIATATSQLTLAVMALTGTLVHIATGAFHRGVRRTIALTIGVLLGAPLGAWLSSRARGDWIIRGLALGLGLVGVRLLLMGL